jgi:hypothetical protein
MSCETLRPLPRLEIVGAFGGRGFLAALMLPRGVEEKVMFAVAPEVETVRGMGRSPGESNEGAASLEEEGLEGAAGDEGEGEPKGVSES